jgi:hypothetical protein
MTPLFIDNDETAIWCINSITNPRITLAFLREAEKALSAKPEPMPDDVKKVIEIWSDIEQLKKLINHIKKLHMELPE